MTVIEACGGHGVWLAVVVSLLLGARANATVQVDGAKQLVTMTDGRGELSLRLSYGGRCVLDRVTVRGREVAAESGVCSAVRVGEEWFTTKQGIASPTVVVEGEKVRVVGIVLGQAGSEVREEWAFEVGADRIQWRIKRTYAGGGAVEDVGFPMWEFARMDTWTGGMLDNGGVVWAKYLDTPDATLISHAGAVTFWSREKRDALRVTPTLPAGQHGGVRFSRQKSGVFSFNYSVSGEELKTRHDLCRFMPDRQDLWAPVKVEASEVSVGFELQALDYDKEFDRGTFKGLSGDSIRELLTTVARYGVIDSGLVGGNGWRSGYICFHEQWFAQMGLALGAADYIANYSKALDFERDHAIAPDGRVKARFKYDAGDAMPGTYDANGFYEAQWGYLMDTQPDYVMNVVEQFDLTGDKAWLAGHKASCEKALEYLLKREVGDTGIVTMLTGSMKEARGSDWIDIIWASHQNALVNAELYSALNLWAGAEETLGDAAAAARYREFAGRLKATFNQTIAQGGFWDPEKQWYAYWREKDGSIRGNNLVTPVNFSAIAYGICDDPARQKAVLDRMEAEMEKEKLFHWPLNFFPYEAVEGSPGNFPYPRYENGDIFLSWGEVAVRAYAAHDPATAVKYIKKTLARYDEDGLSFQRYLRATQAGAGDDILAGNCMVVVGLYRDIYGIRPKPNRLYLEPHMTGELNGTKLRYPLRGKIYEVEPSTEGCAVSVGGVTVRGTGPFGVNPVENGVEYFAGGDAEAGMSVSRAAGGLIVEVRRWEANSRQWTESATPAEGATEHVMSRLRPGGKYELMANRKVSLHLVADEAGRVRFGFGEGYATPVEFELNLALR